MSLCLNKVSFQYPQQAEALLLDFSAQFKEGKITAVMGENGCGKTTLAKIILGILKLQKGEVLIDGENVASMSLAQVGRKIGYVMQNPHQQLFCTSVQEEFAYGLKNLNLSEEEIAVLSDKYLTYFHISQYKEQLPHQLSQGEKQRVVLAAVLAMQPKYLLLDEPTSSLDLYRRQMLGEYLQDICAQSGCGIIIISHDENFVQSYCHDIFMMSKRN